ncbi:hypothetical protein KC345_g10399 [Hortaea werneckii]|nr:hypothetical protein KC345_g10399 [Hortaea werneckii]
MCLLPAGFGLESSLWEQITKYFKTDTGAYLLAVKEHIVISILALAVSALLGISLGYLCAERKRSEQWIVSLFQALRIVPSLAILFLLIPVMGTGFQPAITALILLAIPPVLVNTVAGLAEVPAFMLETAYAVGMTDWQVLWKVRLPLAAPLILTGIKTAAIEIVASATLAAKIGAGGLGSIIFTGLGLNRIDLLLIGGISVAVLSIAAGFMLDRADRWLFKYKFTGNKNEEEGGKSTIRIGSKDFTENLIVGELYALALEDAGYKVERVFNIAGSVIHTSLVNKEIDLYPEYTGTGLLTILKLPLMTDPDEVYSRVKKAYEEQFQATWLDYSKANDGAGLVVRSAVAKELGITTISDLQKHASELRFASQGEVDQREDGIPALEKVYGPLNWKSSKVYDNSLKYEVLSNDEADVAPAYTTEGMLVDTDEFTLLQDDKQVWPPYNLAPVIRDEVLNANPDIAEVINKVSAALDTGTITALNAKVDVDKEEYEDVAKEFYDSIK